jgi:hypothetical protein
MVISRDSSDAMARRRVLFKMAELVRRNAALFGVSRTLFKLNALGLTQP